MIDVSIIIITWNVEHLLRGLLQSIEEHTQDITYEIIVVDNNSHDNTVAMVEHEFKNVHLIRNSENRGVAAARNQGFNISQGKYIVTLDADMVLLENSIKILYDFMNEHPHAGLCGCKLIFPDGTLQSSTRRFPTFTAFFFRRLEFIPFIRNSKVLQDHEITEWDRNDIRNVDYVIGACQFIRRTAMEEVGNLDEKIFYGPEDLDYCLRMHLHGWKVYYYPYTRIIHFWQRITQKNIFSKISWRHFRGIIYLFIKYRGRISYHDRESITKAEK